MIRITNEFSGLQLGDKRLNYRCIRIIEKVFNNPSLSFPKMSENWAWLKGFYRFFSNEKVARGKIMQPHIQNTVNRCMEEEIVLAIQDTTCLDYSNHSKKQGLGLIGSSENGIGMLVHDVFAVSGINQKPLGIIHQQVIVRNEKYPQNETSYQRQKRGRESEKWFLGLKSSQKLLNSHKRVIQICDREADIYLFIKEIIKAKQGFVIRCAQNRSTVESYIFDEVKEARTKCYTEIKVPRNGKRKGRRAKVEIKAGSLQVKAPKIIGAKGEILAVNVVIVEERNSPKDVEPLYWVLLTSESISSEEDCLTVVNYYKARWVIEDFHKGLKTGCKIEERQLSTRAQLEKLLGLFSVMVSQLLLLRFLAGNSDVKIKGNENILTETQIKILKNKFPNECEKLDANKLLILIAKMGGFIGRKSDGNPGWLVLLRGMYDLFLIEQGVLLAKQFMGKG